MGDLDWWGRSTVAHHVPDLRAGKTACGDTLDMLAYEQPFTRLRRDTGDPWPRCKECVKRLAAQVQGKDPKP